MMHGTTNIIILSWGLLNLSRLSTLFLHGLPIKRSRGLTAITLPFIFCAFRNSVTNTTLLLREERSLSFLSECCKLHCRLCTLRLLNLVSISTVSEELGAFVFRDGVIWTLIKVVRIKAWHQAQAFLGAIAKLHKVRRVCLAVCPFDYWALTVCVFM